MKFVTKFKWWHWLLIAVAGVTTLGAVIPSEGPQQNQLVATSAPNTITESTLETNSSASSCIKLPTGVLEAIASGEEAGVGMVPVVGYAIKSPDFENVYFMAIEFKATGIENQVGVWARNGIESGLILSVDGFAKEFTVWPDASKTNAKISGADRSIKVARECL